MDNQYPAADENTGMAYRLTCENCNLDHTVDLEVGFAKFGDHQSNYPDHHPSLVKEHGNK